MFRGAPLCLAPYPGPSDTSTRNAGRCGAVAAASSLPEESARSRLAESEGESAWVPSLDRSQPNSDVETLSIAKISTPRLLLLRPRF